MSAAGLPALAGYVEQEPVSSTLATLAEISAAAEGARPVDVPRDFPALAGLVREAGFERGEAWIVKTAGAIEAVVGVPAEFTAQGIPVYAPRDLEGEVRENLAELATARVIRFVPTAAEAFLVIADRSVTVRPDQVHLQVTAETVSRVTPRLLQELQLLGLLKAGSVVMLYKPLKDSVLILA